MHKKQRNLEECQYPITQAKQHLADASYAQKKEENGDAFGIVKSARLSYVTQEITLQIVS